MFTHIFASAVFAEFFALETVIALEKGDIQTYSATQAENTFTFAQKSRKTFP
jgi:hypothetical protein